jgi:hypothetical protein
LISGNPDDTGSTDVQNAHHPGVLVVENVAVIDRAAGVSEGCGSWSALKRFEAS